MTARTRPRDRAGDPVTLLRQAIAATGRTDVAFAKLPGIAVDPRTVRYWLAGDTAIPPSTLTVCRILVEILGVPDV